MPQGPMETDRDWVRIPEPWFAKIPGKDWDEDAMTSFGDLLQQELLPRWRRQVLASGYLAQQADDVLQEFMVELYKNLIPQYQPHPEGTRLIGYLCQFFAWRMKDAGRSMQRREDREGESLEDHRSEASVIHIDPGKQALLVALRRGIETLPDRRRQVLELRNDGYSFAEIGKLLGIREGHARTEGFMARQQLKRILEKGDAHV